MSQHKSGPSTGHTPGPWAIYGHDEMHGWPFIRVESGAACICEVQPTQDDGDEGFRLCDTDEANARLIAAAPDAKELGDYLSGALEERPDLSDYVDRWRQMSVKDILEVIRLLEVFKKKAEGK